MTDDNLLNELKQAATPPAPRNFRPGIVFDGRMPSEITTPPVPEIPEGEYDEHVRAMGYPLPPGMTLVLVEMQMAQHEALWHRDPVEREDGGLEGSGDAYTAPSTSWRYRFRVVPKSARADEDIATLMAEAKQAPPLDLDPREGAVTKIVNLADFQVGKVDELGGTKEMLARSEAALARTVADLQQAPVAEIVIIDNGDSTEGVESAPNALGTNDLHHTEQIRVWRRILWRWIDALAPHAPTVTVIGVPSNHCRNRRGKNALGSALDDWGIEVIAQVSDIADVNPEAYGHVEFVVPNEHEEHVLHTLVGGQVIGVAHGHQKSSPSQLTTWIKSTGRRGLAQADIVFIGHFHHLVVEAFGDQQWLFIAPTNDNGSSWFTPSSGERSEPGVLTLRADACGWFDLQPLWLGRNA